MLGYLPTVKGYNGEDVGIFAHSKGMNQEHKASNILMIIVINDCLFTRVFMIKV